MNYLQRRQKEAIIREFNHAIEDSNPQLAQKIFEANLDIFLDKSVEENG